METQTKTRTPTRTVLVVDDSATMVALMTQTLEQNGCRVLSAHEGVAGLAQARDADLIFLDITMPGLDGYEVCMRIKENPETARIPVIMVSGKDGFFDKVRGRMVGSTDYITKPFDRSVLVETVQKYCPRPPA